MIKVRITSHTRNRGCIAIIPTLDMISYGVGIFTEETFNEMKIKFKDAFNTEWFGTTDCMYKTSYRGQIKYSKGILVYMKKDFAQCLSSCKSCSRMSCDKIVAKNIFIHTLTVNVKQKGITWKKFRLNQKNS